MYKSLIVFIVLLCYPTVILTDCIYLRSGRIECFKIFREETDEYIIKTFDTRRNRYKEKVILKEDVLAIQHDELIDGTALEPVTMITQADSLRYDELVEREKQIVKAKESQFDFWQILTIATIAVLVANFLIDANNKEKGLDK